jgi:hypothetical protein
MSVPEAVAADILAKCARHCCICRRFRPLHLQVHHIVERGEGGTDEPDNLIAICVSCHADVHTQTKLTRRFTVKELKAHRDEVVRLATEGKLPSSNDAAGVLAAISAALVGRLLATQPRAQVTGPTLLPAAAEMLLAAASSNMAIDIVTAESYPIIMVSGKPLGKLFDLRSMALYRKALDQLIETQLVERISNERFLVTYSGYMVADDLLSAGSQAPSPPDTTSTRPA